MMTLTPREQVIAALILEGRSSKEIGARLAVSPTTVSNTLTALYRKYGVRGRVELAVRLWRERYG